MNKLEEIISNYDILEFGGINQQYIKNQIVLAMSEFGKICFNAGSELAWKSTGDYSGYESYKYKTYEDFLKEIEDERKALLAEIAKEEAGATLAGLFGGMPVYNTNQTPTKNVKNISNINEVDDSDYQTREEFDPGDYFIM